MTFGRNSFRVSSTAKLPLLVFLLVALISAAISERVLDRLSNSQEEFLQGLASTYLAGLSASVSPAVLRGDSWEIYDTLERMAPKDIKIRPTETIVTDPNNVVLASDHPENHPTLTRLTESELLQFTGGRVRIDDGTQLGYHARSIFHQGQMIGKIYAIFDAASLLEERRSVLVTLIITNGALTIFIASVGFFAVRRMVAPMRVLEQHMLDLAGGKLEPISDAEFPKGQSDATRMFLAFNRLAEAEKERQRLVENLAREERLAGLGRLASGMAHEINNPLGGLLNATSTLEKHGEDKHSRQQSIDLIRRGLLNIRDIVQAALATYRPERINRPLARTDISDLGLLVTPELKRRDVRLVQNIHADKDCYPELPAGPIRQALLNLLLNAIAVSRSGSAVLLEFAETKTGFEFAITDTGQGLEARQKDILQAREGSPVPSAVSGLGLWIVREIANDLGADIIVSDLDGSGCEITLAIPNSSRRELSHAA